MNLLITKHLSDSVLDQVRSWGWNFDVVPALAITPTTVTEVPAESDAWVISSRHSRDTVEKFIRQAPPVIFVVGKWLQEKLLATGTKSSVVCFSDMKSLAAEAAARPLKQLLYFCADHHRFDLEEGLKERGVVINKVITHESRVTNPRLIKHYDAVMVLSPRSMDSLRAYNKFDHRVLFACVGPTTENYLHSLGIKKTFCASEPDAAILLNELHHVTTLHSR